MKFLILLIYFIVFQGCRPEKNAAEFNTLISVPLGHDIQIQTLEEKDIEFEYVIADIENSINLEILIGKQPSHGTLKSCVDTSNGKLKCTYSPAKDFYGIDTIEVYAKDGDVKSLKTSIVRIDVINIPDAPIAFDANFSIGSKIELSFALPLALDSDSLSHELSYKIIDGPTHGELRGCNARACKYISNSLYDGVDSITYSVTDDTGLISNIARIEINVTRLGFYATETFNSQHDLLEGADIIWVVDNSNSMSNEQEILQQNFQSFIDNFLEEGKPKFNFNMAITTTDMYLMNSGNPFSKDQNGNQYDLSSVAAQSNLTLFKENFNRAVSVGTAGDGSERSLQSIDKALALAPTWYGGNSRLLVFVILSDEEEQSNDTVANYTTKISSVKDVPGKIQYYPIVNLEKDDGNRYRDLAAISRTSVYDINSSFQAILDDISLSVIGSVKSFSLNPSVNIISDSINVKVNGIETSNFIFEQNKISVKDLPVGDNVIVVSYEYGVF